MPIETFADFSGGWKGTLDLAKVPRNMWDGRNVIVYRDGSIGPRPGLKAFDLGRTTAGKIHGMTYTGAAPGNRQILYLDGTNIYAAHGSNDGSINTLIGTVNSEPTTGIPAKMFSPIDDVAIIQIHGNDTNGFYWIVSSVVTDVQQEGGYASAVYGARLIRGSGSGSGSPLGLRLYYTAPADFADWPALNFIDLPSFDTHPVFIAPQRNHLTIVTIDGQWWVLTGVPGINDVLRKIPTPRRFQPISFNAFTQDAEGKIFFLSPINNYVATFDGSALEHLSYLTMSPEDPQASYGDSGAVQVAFSAVTAVQGIYNAPGFVLKDPVNRLLIQNNNAWSLHDFGVAVGNSWSFDGEGKLFGFGPLQATPNTPTFTMDFRLNRPAFTSDSHAQPGDLSTTPLAAEFTLPEYWSEDSDFVRVNEVVIDFAKFNTGAVGDNQIQVTVESLARGLNESVSNGTQTKTWTEAGSGGAATQDGTPDRVRFTFGEQGAGAGYRVRIHGIRGVKIRSITCNSRVETGNQRVY